MEILTSKYQPYSGITGPSLGCELLDAVFGREGVTVKWTILPQERQKGLGASGKNLSFSQSTLAISQDEQSDFIFNDAPCLYLSVVAFYPKAEYPSGLGLKGPGDLQEKFKSGLKKIKEDGTFIKILGKYYPNGQMNKETLPQDMRCDPFPKISFGVKPYISETLSDQLPEP